MNVGVRQPWIRPPLGDGVRNPVLNHPKAPTGALDLNNQRKLFRASKKTFSTNNNFPGQTNPIKPSAFSQAGSGMKMKKKKTKKGKGKASMASLF